MKHAKSQKLSYSHQHGLLPRAILGLFLLATVGVAQTPSSVSPREAQHFTREGVQIEFTPPTEARAGENTQITLRVTDATTQQPLSGMRPKAWLTARAGAAPNAAKCQTLVRNYASGRLPARPAADLNNFRLVTLNADNSVTFINPLLAFSKTQLESIVPLPGKGLDWVLSKDNETLYVTLPEQKAVGVINTVTRKLLATLPLAGDGQPTRIGLQPDGRFIWVGLDNAPRVAVIDAATKQFVGTIVVGAGRHTLAFSDDSRFVYVTNSQSDSVTAIDAQARKPLATIAVGKTPLALAFSQASRMFYAAALNGETITVIEPESRKVIASPSVTRGVTALQFDPDGRFAVVVNQLASTISVLDSANNQLIATASVGNAPDQITFTSRYAYVRNLASEKFALLELKELRAGKIAPVEIQAGQLAPATETATQGVAAMIAAMPSGNGAMIANAPDRKIYFYSEGMMVSSGALDNYKRAPLGVLILDNGLRESAAGVYRATVKLGAGGTYDLPILLDQPRAAGQPPITHCFQLTVSGAAREADDEHRLQITPLFAGQSFHTATPTQLQFKVHDAAGQPLSGLRDVRALVLMAPGLWQVRQWAQENAPGVYGISQTFAAAGSYTVLVSIGSRGLSFTRSPRTVIEVKDSTAKP